MKIKSPAFEANGSIPALYTCEGENISPPLVFEDIPESTVSLVLIMEDPDVPTHLREDGMWDHWVVWNIPENTAELKEGEVPPGVVGLSTREVNAYGGPCPPDKEHRYFFYLYALDSNLGIPAESFKKDLLSAMEGHVIEKAELMGRYNKKENV